MKLKSLLLLSKRSTLRGIIRRKGQLRKHLQKHPSSYSEISSRQNPFVPFLLINPAHFLLNPLESSDARRDRLSEWNFFFPPFFSRTRRFEPREASLRASSHCRSNLSSNSDSSILGRLYVTVLLAATADALGKGGGKN